MGVLTRSVVFLLALGIGGGPAAVDGCLVTCHTDAPVSRAAAPGHCHAAASEAAPDVQQVTPATTCHHDHEAAWADARETRTSSALKAPLGLPAVHPASLVLSSVPFRAALNRSGTSPLFLTASVRLRV